MFMYSPSAKAFYHSDINYVSLPSDVMGITDEQHSEMVSRMNNGEDVLVENSTIRFVPRLDTPLTMAQVRYLRNAKLAICDWTQLADVPVSDKKAAWAVYRQSLRDLPQKYTSPSSIVWPTEPN